MFLDRKPAGEFDEYVPLSTRAHGRLSARAVSSRKMHSKFSHHLDPLTHVKARLVGAGSYVLADALPVNRFTELRKDRAELAKALRIASFIRNYFPEGGVDERAWDFFEECLRKARMDARGLLGLLGFGAGEACRKCAKKSAERFFIPDHAFLCVSCSSKMPENQLLYI